MAERIVDVLEVVEVDIEHGRRCAAVADLVDHRLKPLAEEDAVRQAAERIVHGEMAQARFAGGDRRGGAAHVAQHEGRRAARSRSSATAMNGTTLWTISAPGCFGVQAKRAMTLPSGPVRS